jgi:elongation factor G
MQVVPTERIRNVALVGHNGAGKTTLAEALLFVTGAIPRRGRVEDGTTVMDHDPEEHRRQQSTGLSMAVLDVEGHKINLIDVPGSADFLGDVAVALRVADFAVFVVSAVDGVGAQTEVAWRLAAEHGVPRAVFVNQLDRERADFDRVLVELQAVLGAGIAPVELPIGTESAFHGVVDLMDDHAMFYDDESGIGREVPMPEELVDREHMVHDALIEGIVVADDALMERYLADEPIALDELEHALAVGIAAGTVFPVLCGSARKLVGVDRLARFLVHEGPAPAANVGPSVALVFKTIVDPYLGRVNLCKVLQGRIVADDKLTNSRTLSEERLHNVFTLRGKEQIKLGAVEAGDIVGFAKLSDTGTGDVLGVRGASFDVPALAMPEPTLGTAITVKTHGDDDKLATALHRLTDEDPSVRVEHRADTHQTVLLGMGETHLAIALDKLTRRFGVAVETYPVKVSYRETISGRAEAEGKHKKQSGGHGQFAVANLRVEPNGRGDGFRFVDAVVGGAIPRQYIPAVEKGLLEAMSHGVFGVPVVDVTVTCFDGKYHSVDSSEMAFKTAAAIGLREALAKAGPVLLEPVSELVVTAPDAYQGDLLGDLNARRGRIRGSQSVGGGRVEITALVPTSELLRYVVDLRSLTGGRATFTVSHSHYDPAPPQIAEKVRAAAHA